MRQVTKVILLLATVWLGLVQHAGAFALMGPVGFGGDSWQTPDIGFTEVIGPRNLGEEYRRNTPVIFYTYDQTFLDYFGSAGMAAVDKAFTILNHTFTNSPTGPATGLDGYSANLSEFPLESRHLNYQAQALGVISMDSELLYVMTLQFGLIDPIRYMWNIHDRYLPPGGSCPADEEYLVVQRNFDYISSPLDQLQYSAYVNDVLYSYQIVENCTGPNPLAEAVPYSVDPLADVYSPLTTEDIYWGAYYTGLTRDDVAGMRYLISSNNVNYEAISPDSLLLTVTTSNYPTVFPPYVVGGTNFSNGTNTGYYIFTGSTNGGYGYGDYTAFLAFASTNPPAVLQAAYPGVVITSVSNSATIVSNATIISYYTNAPYGSPYGSPPTLVVVTNYTPIFEVLWYYTFGNVFTNHYTKGYEELVTVTVSAPIGSPYGSGVVTNLSIKKIPTVSSDFFVLTPFYGYTNSLYTNVCPIDILTNYGSISNVLSTTNLLTVAVTNTSAYTNFSISTNITSYTYLVNFFTNYSYLIDPVTCGVVSNAAAYFQGVEKFQFVYVPYTNYDTVSGSFYEPVTNYYTLVLVTNGLTKVQYLQRIMTAPDFVISAVDTVAGGGASPAVPVLTNLIIFNTTYALNGLAGPGTVVPSTRISFNKSGPVYFNTPSGGMDGTPYFTSTPGGDLADDFYLAYYVLGDFDGTTNPPTIFPSGTSIDNLEHQVLIQISPLSVANGALNQSYGQVQFTASGGALVPPLSWSASGLPPGMSMSTPGVLSGTPLATGTYDFTVIVTDSNSLSVQWNYSILIQ